MWNALSDACKYCAILNGREWTDQDIFQSVLWDPIWGNLWDLDAGRSLMHGGVGTCRCQLTVRVEMDVLQLEEYVGFDELADFIRRMV